MSTFLGAVAEALRERDRRERDSFVAVFESYRQLLNKTKDLESRNYLLDKKLQSTPSHSAGPAAGLSASTSVVDAARLSQAEDKASKLQEELTAALRSKDVLQSEHIRLKNEAAAVEKLAVSRTDELNAVKRRLSDVDDEKTMIMARMKELQAIIDILQNETSGCTCQGHFGFRFFLASSRPVHFLPVGRSKEITLCRGSHQRAHELQ